MRFLSSFGMTGLLPAEAGGAFFSFFFVLLFLDKKKYQEKSHFDALRLLSDRNMIREIWARAFTKGKLDLLSFLHPLYDSPLNITSNLSLTSSFTENA